MKLLYSLGNKVQEHYLRALCVQFFLQFLHARLALLFLLLPNSSLLIHVCTHAREFHMLSFPSPELAFLLVTCSARRNVLDAATTGCQRFSNIR